jgi:16S rRNA (cytidine1402-2'-O)-methyltransferase
MSELVSDKKKLLAPGLYLVATPIGNLEDITLRALRVLQSVDRIACEDTRQTQKLLHHFQIKNPTVSYHTHNEGSRSEDLIAELKAGGRVAIVSDAGTPGIADPGGVLVQAAIAAGIPVFPVPGANAAISALIASGLPTESFIFHGFLPSKAGQRKTFFEEIKADFAAAQRDDKHKNPTHVFYDSPQRIIETLADVESVFGASHGVVVARELTKIHEEFLRGTVSEVRETLAARDSVRGEIVLLMAGEFAAAVAAGSIADAVSALMKDGLSEKDALKRVARDRGLGKSEAYREWQRSR